MGLLEKQQIVHRLSPPLDNLLVHQLVDEFTEMEKRFIQRDWGPTELDAGHFSEALARVLYQADSGAVDYNRMFDDCLKYVETHANRHAIQPRTDATQVANVLRTIYKFRNRRGVAHISPNYDANHMDAKFVVEAVRWCMNEVLRLFWQGDKEKAAKAIRELLQFDVPAVGVFEENLILVQRTDLSPEEELLLLLHYAGESGFTRNELGHYCRSSPASVTRAIQSLTSPKSRQVVKLGSGAFRLTDLGAKRIRESLSAKLLLQ